jgi:chemotaxis response regulator CheB
VLLVDDHPAVRRVLRSLLEEVGGWQVVGEADSGEAALPLVEQLVPDVVLMDCRSASVARLEEADRLVRGMGGRVWVEDNQGGGARFGSSCPTRPRYRFASAREPPGRRRASNGA